MTHCSSGYFLQELAAKVYDTEYIYSSALPTSVPTNANQLSNVAC
jgi:hypothetical protein